MTLLCLLAVAACGQPPRPFEHDDSEAPVRALPQDKTELAIAPPKNMPAEMAKRVAAALAIELQSYGIVAAVQPAAAPIEVNGTMSTRDADLGIEIQIDWRVAGAPAAQEPATSKTRARPEDYAEASEPLVSRIAQQAAPRVATLIGRPPTFQARSPGQVAAGVSVPMEPDAPALAAASVPGAAPTAASQQQQQPQVKVMVAPVTGAPSDGNVVKWLLKDPAGKSVGDLEQANPVPLAAAKGSWAGFGDIVATAASEGVLELLEKAINRSH